jgi:hypothetical protein
MPRFGNSDPRTVVAVAVALGVLVEIPALLLALASAGAGHGDYIAARALFAGPMVLTLVQGDRIGALSIAVGLVQFPVYGGVVGWCLAESRTLPVVAVALLHLAAVAVAFSGILPGFD